MVVQIQAGLGLTPSDHLYAAALTTTLARGGAVALAA